MDKEAAKIIRKQRKKEREKTKWKRATHSHTAKNRVVERLVQKRYKANFNWTWFTVAIKEVEDKFHQNFQAGFKAHSFRYKGVNLGISTHVQSEVKARAKTRMLAKGHVLAWLQQPSIA